MSQSVSVCTQFVIAIAVGAVCSSASAQQTDQRPLSLGITGATPSETHKNPTAILNSAEMQRFILTLSEEPKSRNEVEEAIRDESFTLDDMINVGLIRVNGDLCYINFNLLRVVDQQRIMEVAEQRGRDLAAAILAARSEFETLASAHDQAHFRQDEFLFIILGCFSLDWDGLSLTQELGYRAGAQCMIDGYEFTPWAKETGAAVSLKGLYWGSHRVEGPVTFTTFGDHDALPRFGLPDLMWNTGTDFAAYGALKRERRAAIDLVDVYAAGAFEDMGAVLLALRDEDLSSDELATATGIDAEKLSAILAVLEAAEYVDAKDGAYSSSVLTLTTDDKELIEATVAKGREIMVAWHEANYDEIRTELSDLTPLTQGVPFERVYTEVWHFIFGNANRQLVEVGFFANPYADNRVHKGFVPFVWTSDLAEIVP